MRIEGAQAMSLRISGRGGKAHGAKLGGVEGGNPENVGQGATGRACFEKEVVFHMWLWIGFQDNSLPARCI